MLSFSSVPVVNKYLVADRYSWQVGFKCSVYATECGNRKHADCHAEVSEMRKNTLKPCASAFTGIQFDKTIGF